MKTRAEGTQDPARTVGNRELASKSNLDHKRSLRSTYRILVAVAVILGGVGDSVLVAQRWVFEGHAPAKNGQVENVTDRPVAGAIEAVVAHPTDANILWVGAVNGGIFRTNNATAVSPTWTAQTDAQASLSIGALELDPTDATQNTLVAGIGRTSSFTRITGGRHTGVLRTTDGGTKWVPLPSIGIKGITISGVAARGDIIVVAAAYAGILDGIDRGSPDTGIYRSTDGGASFVHVSGAAGTGLAKGRAFDLASDPTDPTRLFTIIDEIFVPNSAGIYRSDDTGATWTRISNADQEALLNDIAVDANLAVGRAGPISPNLFAAICTTGSLGTLAGLYRTADASAVTPVWTALDIPQTTEISGVFGIHPGGQCALHLSLVADPDNANVVYVGGDRQPGPLPNAIGSSTFTGRLFRVDAGQAPGSQATPITHCSTGVPAGCGGMQRTASNSAPHADSREMVFDANGDIIEVDDGGVYRHTNPGGTTGDWVSVNGTLSAAEQHDSAYDAVSNIIFSGNQDTGTVQQETPTSRVWHTISGGDGGDVAVAENDPIVGQSSRYVSFQYFQAPRRLVIDANNVLQSIAPLELTPLGGSPAPTSFPFVTPIEINATSPARLILGAGNGTYESNDRLDSVSLISTAVVNSSGRGPIAYGVVGNADALYFGSGHIVYTRTEAPPVAPVASDPDADSNDRIAGVVVDPNNANTAFAVDTDQVFRTTNAGGDWEDVTGNLQSLSPEALLSIEYISGGGDRLVVGASKGVFVATEASGFSTWAELGAGLPHAPVLDLAYDASGDTLVAGTLGRGAWTLSLGTPACAPDAFEPDDNAAEARTITSGVQKHHNICPVRDNDWSTFTLTEESGVTIETSGLSGDTRMFLRDAAEAQIEANDDGGFGLFSLIDRDCGLDPLPAGSYFVEVDEFGDHEGIPSYALSLVSGACVVCTVDLVLANQTLSGEENLQATATATLGPNLVVNGSNIVVRAPTVTVFNGTEIGGTFSVGNNTFCY